MTKQTKQPEDVPLYSQRIRRERLKKGWSQRRLADEIDTNIATISRWETGVWTPNPHYRQELMRVFDTTAEELAFVDEDEPICVETDDKANEDASPANTSVNVPVESATPEQESNTPAAPAPLSVCSLRERRSTQQRMRSMLPIPLLVIFLGLVATSVWVSLSKTQANPSQTLTGALTTASTLSYTKPTSKPTHRKGTSTSTPGTPPTPTATTSASGHGPVGSSATPTRVPTPTSAPAGTRSYTEDQDMAVYGCDGQPCPVEIVAHVNSVKLLSPNGATVWFTFTNTSSSQDWNNVDYSHATLGSSSALDTPLFSVPAGQAQTEHLDFDNIDIRTGQQYTLDINLQVSGAFTYYFKITLTWCSNPCH